MYKNFKVIILCNDGWSNNADNYHIPGPIKTRDTLTLTDALRVVKLLNCHLRKKYLQYA